MGSCPTKTPTRLSWKRTIRAVALDLKGRVSRCALLINRAAVLNLLIALAHRAHIGLCAVSLKCVGLADSSATRAKQSLQGACP